MKRAILLSALAVLLMVGQLTAATIRYQNSGDWFDADLSDSIGWQSDPNLPGALDTARINWGGNTVTLAGNAPTITRLQIGVDESGTLEVNSGGVLTTTEHVFAGNNGATATGTLNVNNGGEVNVGKILWSAFNVDTTGNININNGGVVNVASHLWLGYRGTSTINISGTLNQTGGILGLGTNNASTPGGGTATVNVLSDGLLALNNISSDEALPSIQPGSLLNISGTGQLTLPGNFEGVIQDYADNGLIVGNGILGNISIAVTGTPEVDQVTTVTAIPEPSTLLLLGLGLGGLLLGKRR